MTKSSSANAGLSVQERQTVKDRAKELRAEAKRQKQADKLAAERADVLAKFKQMPDGDKQMAERISQIVTEVAPELTPKLYYGQPGWARDSKVVVFFRSGQKDKLRYSTFGVSPNAPRDASSGLWTTSYALIDPTETAWAELTDIV